MLLGTTCIRGVARSFQRGGITLCRSEGTHQIARVFLPPVVGLLKIGLQKRGESQASHDLPSYATEYRPFPYSTLVCI